MKKIQIYVDDEVIYNGTFSEVPEFYRSNLIDCLDEWSGVLSKKSINELLYSSLYWYNQKKMYCTVCTEFFEDQSNCPGCKEDLVSKFVYDRNSNFDKILDCIGMITKVEMITS